ncbi:ABC transporter transmembrane domain-containing protein [Paenibacillus sp. JCM 10914]|uniref:ABC transporter ATP-binding protein n=1 Tax=Paenibacillus sp. JCM 10914 TaxID=1236974 RepID=UPI0003CC6A2C|nr:ABC transporter ATP-binding protein [Paenibacillus sp. JCM 10914]GAE10044.1 lipid A export ATP-binding/permease protein MsbA [Paenibacillus sp. JCM 10914]
MENDVEPKMSLLQDMRRYSIWLGISVVFSIISAVTYILLANVFNQIIESVLSKEEGSLGGQISIIAAIIAVGMLSIFMNRFSSAKFSASVTHRIRIRIYRHLKRMTVEQAEKKQVGDIVARLTNDLPYVNEFLKKKITNYFYHPIMIVLSLTYLIILNWQLLLSCILVVPVFILIVNITTRPITKLSEQAQHYAGEANSVAQDSIYGIQMIKIFATENQMEQKYSSVLRDSLNKSLLLEKKKSALGSIQMILQSLPIIICFVLGGYFTIYGRLQPGELIIYMFLLNFMVQSISEIPGLMADYRELKGIVKRIGDFFVWRTESCDEGQTTTGLRIVTPIHLEFKDVSFSYQDRHNVLQNISFAAGPNRIVAVIGSSGSGKSTLFKLICGFYDNSGGLIEMNGTEIGQIDRQHLRSLISIVSQDSYLFPVTIAENIALGKPEASLEEIIAAAKSSHAHDFIIELPEGYQTMVGERGMSLSGGQRQRISIARAIIKNAPIILMDEPTSALDMGSENVLQENLTALWKDKTVLIVTHRLTTIRDADLILVLDQGKIVQRGTHHELLEKDDGLYRRLHDQSDGAMLEEERLQRMSL